MTKTLGTRWVKEKSWYLHQPMQMNIHTHTSQCR